MMEPFKSGLCDGKAHPLNHYRVRVRNTGTLFPTKLPLELMSTVSQTPTLRSY